MDEENHSWESKGVETKIVNGKMVCETTHLTDFAGFKVITQKPI